jgi:energy-coupling factor transporter transmembrane protein EcfT
MKCQHCAHNYSAACDQPAPGGSSAPGCFFALAILFGAATAGFFVAGIGWPKWLLLGITSMVVLVMFIAWSDCRDVTCPECGNKNTVFPWSI